MVFHYRFLPSGSYRIYGQGNFGRDDACDGNCTVHAHSKLPSWHEEERYCSSVFFDLIKNLFPYLISSGCSTFNCSCIHILFTLCEKEQSQNTCPNTCRWVVIFETIIYLILWYYNNMWTVNISSLWLFSIANSKNFNYTIKMHNIMIYYKNI